MRDPTAGSAATRSAATAPAVMNSSAVGGGSAHTSG